MAPLEPVLAAVAACHLVTESVIQTSEALPVFTKNLVKTFRPA